MIRKSLRTWLTSQHGTDNGCARCTRGAPRVEHIARVLLRRYGVVFHKLLERENGLPPWRELFYVYRRLEARGKVQGGRFVGGCSGEQFALADAAAALRKQVPAEPVERIALTAVDPLNLIGTLTPDGKIPRLRSNRVLFENGVPAAVYSSRRTRHLEPAESATAWDRQLLLVHKPQVLSPTLQLGDTEAAFLPPNAL